MNETKLNLNIILPGRTLLSAKECAENPKESYERQKIRIETVEKDPKKKNKFIKSVEWIDIKVRKCRTASQSINMTKDAYDYMVSKECPYFAKPKDWARMSKVKRLEAHLEETCKALGGISYTYQIFED
jgi:hypothetical protein